MKRTTLILSLTLLISLGLKAQNYIGMSQTKIVFTFGQPDEKGVNYYVYYDQNEDGSNIYYFDEHKICTVFEMKRSKDYLKEYEKMLKKDFEKLPEGDNKFYSKLYHFDAELIVLAADFQIKISRSSKSPEGTSACLVQN